MNSQDPRVQELLDLAHAENITLPMPVDMIVYFENQGKFVDLVTGKVYDAVIATPTPSAKAVLHLLGHVEGDIFVT
jgi:hypothetical protein